MTLVKGRDLFVNPFDRPGLHPLGGGRLLAHWLQKSAPDTYAYDVILAHSLDGGHTWSQPYRLHEDGSPVEHGFPSVAALADGRAHIYWLDGRDSPSEENYTTTLWMRAWKDGALGPEQSMDPLTCDCCATAAIPFEAGSLVAYRDRTEKEIRDISTARVVDERPQSPSRLAPDGWEIAGCPVNGPALAASSSSSLAVWPTFANETMSVQVSWSAAPGRPFGPPLKLSTGSTLGRVDAIMMGGGTALVSWLEAGEDGPTIVTREVGTEGPTGAPVQRAGPDPGLASCVPRIEGHLGRVYLAWVSSTDSSIQFAQIK